MKGARALRVRSVSREAPLLKVGIIKTPPPSFFLQLKPGATISLYLGGARRFNAGHRGFVVSDGTLPTAPIYSLRGELGVRPKGLSPLIYSFISFVTGKAFFRSLIYLTSSRP